MEQRKSFILYQNFENQFNLLSIEDRGILISAIFEYARTGDTSFTFSPVLEMAFSYIKDTMDRDHEAYMKRQEINAKNGAKGGRPKKPQEEIPASKPKKTEKTERFFSKPNKTLNDNDIDIDIDIDIDNDNDIVIDNGIGNGNGNSITPPRSAEAPLPPKKEELYSCAEKPEAESVNEWAVLSEEDRITLRSKGISQAYIDERLERAAAYAEANSKSLCSVLIEWWGQDRSRYPPNRAYSRQNPSDTADEDRSFDIDTFFDAACRRLFEED